MPCFIILSHCRKNNSNNYGVVGLKFPQGLETYFYMHKYTELLTFLTKIRISEYKHIQVKVLYGGQFAYRPRSNRYFSESVQHIFEM